MSADIEGNFTINVPANATLVVSYVGYDPMEVAVNGQKHLNIVMKTNAQMLQETVVIGYGSVKKSDATGSVAVINPAKSRKVFLPRHRICLPVQARVWL